MITYKCISRIGNRIINEDCTGMHQVGKNYGFFLADGLGGHGKGDLASKTAIEQAIIQFDDQEGSLSSIEMIFESGQNRILEIQKKTGNDMGIKTTMTALLYDQKQINWGHIGDSRIYYFQNKHLVSRTLDHSVPQMLAAAGEIKERDIRNHPDRNRLLRVMGVEWERPLYQIVEPIQASGKQAFLMCSDGFWELINEKEMVTLLKKAKTVEQWLDSMEAIVVKHGYGKNMDNYSAIAVWLNT